MAEPVRIVGHKRTDSTEDNEGLQAQVMRNGALLTWEEGYVLSDVDETSATKHYYGYVDRTGGWYIMEKTIGTNTYTYRYFAGTESYTVSWALITTLVYDYWYNIF